MCHIFFIHSSVDGHLGCFHVLAIVNTVNKIFLFYKEDQNYGLLNNYLKENPIFKHRLILIFFNIQR